MIRAKRVIAATKVIREIRETKEIREIREIREIKGMQGQTAMYQDPRVHRAFRGHKEWLAKRAIQETSASKVLRAFRDPKELLAKKVTLVTLVNRAPLGCKALLACRDRGCRAFRANKEWLAPQESLDRSDLLVPRVFKDRQVPIAVVQDQVVVAQ